MSASHLQPNHEMTEVLKLHAHWMAAHATELDGRPASDQERKAADAAFDAWQQAWRLADPVTMNRDSWPQYAGGWGYCMTCDRVKQDTHFQIVPAQPSGTTAAWACLPCTNRLCAGLVAEMAT